MERKTFTVEEANQVLPALRRVMSLLQERMRWLAAHRPDIAWMVRPFKIPNEGPVPPEYAASLLQVREALEEIDALGCQIKDVQAGLVDFPARLGGREVLLCWKVGEEAVEFYHDPEAGYAGRRPLPAPPGDGPTGGGTTGDPH